MIGMGSCSPLNTPVGVLTLKPVFNFFKFYLTVNVQGLARSQITRYKGPPRKWNETYKNFLINPFQTAYAKSYEPCFCQSTLSVFLSLWQVYTYLHIVSDIWYLRKQIWQAVSIATLPFLQYLFCPDELLAPGGAVVALFKQTPAKILSPQVFSRTRPLFLQTSIRISCVLHSNYAFVLLKHQVDETKSEYIDPVYNESMLSPTCINRDLCKLHPNLSLQTRACLWNRGAGWSFSTSGGFKGLSTTIMVNLTAPLAARLSPTLGKKADDLMVASRYGRYNNIDYFRVRISKPNFQEKHPRKRCSFHWETSSEPQPSGQQWGIF